MNIIKSKIQNLKWVGIFAIAFTFASGGAEASAQRTGKIFRIGYLDGGTASGSAVHLETQELDSREWIEGKNFSIEQRFAELKNERLHELAAELVRLKVDLIEFQGAPQR